MKKGQLVAGILIFLSGIFCFLSIFFIKEPHLTSMSIPLVCLGVFLSVYAFDWNAHKHSKKQKIRVGTCMGKKFIINGVNVFDFLDNGKCKEEHISAQIFDDNDFEKACLLADKIKVTGKNLTFFVYIAQVSTVIYAVFVEQKDCNRLFASRFLNAYLADDSRQNYAYRCQMAKKHGADCYVESIDDCVEIIYSQGNETRACIVKFNNIFKVVVERMHVYDEEEYGYGGISLNPFWQWINESPFCTYADTLERARVLAKEDLHIL